MNSATFARKDSQAPASSPTGRSVIAGGLRIGEAGDAYEREADRVARDVVSDGVPKRHWSLSSLGGRSTLQRKCSCGGSAGDEGECEQCQHEKEQQTLQRKAAGSVESRVAPGIVHEVLSAPGSPLDRGAREYFEPRFGHDFSRVRIHSGWRAAESARAVAAEAYTVGYHVVLGAGHSISPTPAARTLLAHELTHVWQQESGTVTGGAVPVTAVDAHEERQAERTAGTVVQGGRVQERPMRSGAALSRQPVHEPKDTSCDTACKSLESMRNAVEHLCKLAGENTGKCTDSRKTLAESEERTIVGKCQCQKSGDAVNKVNQSLSEDDKKRIVTKTKAAAPTGPVASFANGTRFVLHDTGKKQKTVTAEKKRIAEHQRNERGPLDDAAAAWVTSAGDPFIARPQFFDARRPTATEFEKRADLLSVADREKAFQKVWNASQPKQQTDALDRALAGLVLVPKTGESKKDIVKRAITERTLTPDEAAGEQSKASTELNTPVPAKRKKPDPLIHTTAAWTIAELCAIGATAGVKAVANPGQEKDFTDGCAALKAYFDARDPRLGSMTNVEILAEEGSDCRTTGKGLKPFPPYDPAVFQGVTSLFLQAALQAGSYPEITTHFWVDRTAGDHCDPRCFDLNGLYAVIASTMGHGKGSTYGLKPSYGVTQGVHNVWWLPTVCGGSPPP
jgi:Domain of unknown function (DUF4157)